MKKWISLLALLLTSHTGYTKGRIQNEDIKSLTDITAAVLTTTGNLTSGNACIASPASTSGLATGLFIYDTTTSANVASGTTIAGLPGSCSAGQVQMSANAAGSGTGDTLTFGGQSSQLINDTKIWLTSLNPNTQLSNAISKGLIGGSGGSKNYLSTYVSSTGSGNANAGNGNFEQGTTSGWSLGTVGTLTNGLPTGTPTFGSGASGNLSISAVSSSQIAGNYSLSYASSAATTQGNMLASSAANIDTEDQGKVLTVKFYYSTNTGSSNVNYSGTSSNSYSWAVYDSTNSSWLTSSGNFCITQSSGTGYCTGTVQTNSNTQAIRMVLYNANATAGAATLYLDDFSVGPQTAPIGVPATDPVAYTPTFTGLGTVSGVQVYWQRLGKNIHIYGQVVAGSTSGTLTATLPPGLVIDSSYGAAGVWVPSGLVNANVGNGAFTLITMASAGDTVISFGEQAASASSGSQMSGGFFSSGQTIRFNFIAPIAGWSSNVQMSNDTDTRVVAANFGGAAAGVSSGSIIIFPTTTFDTHAAYNASTGIYTAPVSGYYSINSMIQSNQTSRIFHVYINGSDTYFLSESASAGSFNVAPGQITIKVNAGDQITIRPSGGSSTTLGSGTTVSINKISGPAVVAASEKVFAIYTNNGGTTLTASTTNADFSTKVVDSHAAWNGSVFTAPVSGMYSIKGSMSIGSNTALSMFAYVNGSKSYILTGDEGTSHVFHSFHGDFKLNAGDTLSVRSDAGVTLSNSNGQFNHWISIMSQ